MIKIDVKEKNIIFSQDLNFRCINLFLSGLNDLKGDCIKNALIHF